MLWLSSGTNGDSNCLTAFIYQKTADDQQWTKNASFCISLILSLKIMSLKLGVSRNLFVENCFLMIGSWLSHIPICIKQLQHVFCWWSNGFTDRCEWKSFSELYAEQFCFNSDAVTSLYSVQYK